MEIYLSPPSIYAKRVGLFFVSAIIITGCGFSEAFYRIPIFAKLVNRIRSAALVLNGKLVYPRVVGCGRCVCVGVFVD